jgi:hypothetical protein
MPHHVSAVIPLRYVNVGGLALLGLLVASCGDNPTAPSSDVPAPELTLASNVTGLQLRKDFLRLRGDGSVMVFLRARCPAGYHVIEGPVTVAQPPRTQTVFGEGFFTTTCDGTWHRINVRVTPPEARFREGRARVSASLMVENAAGDFQQGDAGGVLTVVRVVP